MKTFRDVIMDGIDSEKAAINYYTFLIPFIHNGNERRSLEHILKEEQEHLIVLQKMIRKV